MATEIPESQLADLLDRLTRVQDRDRVRLVSAAADNWKWRCEQVARLIPACAYGDAAVAVAARLYSRLADPENWDSVVLAAFKYEEDRTAVKQAIAKAAKK